jgi:hypothetical protein
MDLFDPAGLLEVAFVLAVWFYVVTPILIAFTSRVAADPDLVPFDIDDPALPADVAAYYGKTVKALSRIGFEPVEAFAISRHVRRVKAIVLILVNRTTRDTAWVSAFYATTGAGLTLKSKSVAFSSRFSDGTAISTSNIHLLPSFKRPRNRRSIRFPMVSDPDRLYRLHQALADEHTTGGGKVLRLDEEFGGDALAFQRASLIEECESQVECGRYYKSRDGKAYLPTWNGAYLMTWGLLPPIKQIRNIAHTLAATRLLRKLESHQSRNPG